MFSYSARLDLESNINVLTESGEVAQMIYASRAVAKSEPLLGFLTADMKSSVILGFDSDARRAPLLMKAQK
jgi:hypothetical protein